MYFFYFSGHPAHILDESNPDWVPHLKLGYGEIQSALNDDERDAAAKEVSRRVDAVIDLTSKVLEV